MVWLKKKITQIRMEYMEAIEACIRRTVAAHAQQLVVFEQQLHTLPLTNVEVGHDGSQ